MLALIRLSKDILVTITLSSRETLFLVFEFTSVTACEQNSSISSTDEVSNLFKCYILKKSLLLFRFKLTDTPFKNKRFKLEVVLHFFFVCSVSTLLRINPSKNHLWSKLSVSSVCPRVHLSIYLILNATLG